MSLPLLALGPHRFQIDRLNFQKFTEEFGVETASMKHFGHAPGVQVVGFSDDAKSISGLLFPEEFGDRSDIDAITMTIRAMQPVPLLSWAAGGTFAALVHGRFIIKNIKKDHDYFNSFGQSCRISYSIDVVPFHADGKPTGQYQ